ncbi:type II secretion system protein [Burkholderia cepacia]|uniref:type II secretion system protein n=1 Tax=Burkholderia cepacia TaxID=292 RepID=UPI00158DDC80|nr:type II secretion system protein [Burkholderia cepacia]
MYRGFSLLETVVVLAVVSLIVVMGLQVEKSGTQTSVNAMQRAQLKQAHQTVMLFALRAFRLPCPDATGSGYETLLPSDPTQTHCQSSVGWFPYYTLQLQMPNGASNRARMRYGVYRGATDSAIGLSGADDAARATNFAKALVVVAALQQPPNATLAYPYVSVDMKCVSAQQNPGFALELDNGVQDRPMGNCFVAELGAQSVQIDVEGIGDLLTQLNDVRTARHL